MAVPKGACGFRDSMGAVTKANAVVLGVSRDNIDSHSQFICKLNLPFTLLSAPAANAEAHPAEGLEFLKK